MVCFLSSFFLYISLPIQKRLDEIVQNCSVIYWCIIQSLISKEEKILRVSENGILRGMSGIKGMEELEKPDKVT